MTCPIQHIFAVSSCADIEPTPRIHCIGSTCILKPRSLFGQQTRTNVHPDELLFKAALQINNIAFFSGNSEYKRNICVVVHLYCLMCIHNIYQAFSGLLSYTVV